MLGPIFVHFQYFGAAAWHEMVVMLAQTRQSCPDISATAKVSCLSATTTIRSWGRFCVGRDFEEPEPSVSKMSGSLHHLRVLGTFPFRQRIREKQVPDRAGMRDLDNVNPCEPSSAPRPISTQSLGTRAPTSPAKLIPGASRRSDFSPTASFPQSLPCHPSSVLLCRRPVTRSLMTTPPPSP